MTFKKHKGNLLLGLLVLAAELAEVITSFSLVNGSVSMRVRNIKVQSRSMLRRMTNNQGMLSSFGGHPMQAHQMCVAAMESTWWKRSTRNLPNSTPT